MKRHLLSVVTKAVVGGLVFGCALVLPARVHAQTQTQPPPAATGGGGLGQGFGEAGQIVISNEAFFGFDKVNHEGWALTLKPAADYFVVPAVSVGLVAAYVQQSGDRKSEGIGARAGFNLNLTENLGVWPKAGVTYQHASAGSASASTTWLTVFVPVAYHIIPHVFVALAPYYNVKVAGDGNHGYGFDWVVGVWF